ncbi:methyl-accepting chemotaxis protein [Beggiatoa leptomitoformis]|uniref:HAMP domain-containing protein n=1 Tax=Beggiatoa leptomitoformis TaxID=288004 RepID=A0A2N9YBH3_9GAMM|nr:methyl-accepting chemotaxis protein [Beggiatoa leptomitoformis]AUI67769.1 HAMP domain-containing protein [Beggiatoa leptomitoformis]QGX03507.1 HAMP domain-containing protein [Beggiatoa leptomitoformis]
MFTTIKVSTRLWFGFGAMILFMLMVGISAILQLQVVSGLTTKLYNHPYTVSKSILEIHTEIWRIRNNMKDITIAGEDAEKIKQLIDDNTAIDSNVLTLLDILDDRYLGEQSDIAALRTEFIDWVKLREKIYLLPPAERVLAIREGDGAHSFSVMLENVKKIITFASNKAVNFLENANHEANQVSIWVLVVMCSVTLVGFWTAFSIARSITIPLHQAVQAIEAITRGKLDNVIKIHQFDEIGKLLQAFSIMQTQLRERIQKDKLIMEEALRIKQAVDSSTTSVLIMDSQFTIIYLNKSAHNLFKQMETCCHQELVQLRADTLLNQSIDVLYKSPQQQRDLFTVLTTSQRAKFNLETLHIEYIVTPVFNEQGERIGYVQEFFDRTVEVATEKEINSVIQSASCGDFEQRVDLKNKLGFFNTFSAGVNVIMDYNQLAVKDLMRIFSALAKGDLSQTVENDYLGALDTLKNDINSTVIKITAVMRLIQESADMVNTASEEIMLGNTSLSQRTEEQAAALEETAASMEEMTSTVQQNADNARQAIQLAITAQERANAGGTVVNQAVQAMGQISSSSRQVSDIIGVIDEIAFQTNLLALNAAVEAARAGEQGRGFAVVASEVRHLAQRSASAAKEIKNLIRDSVQKVEDGTRLVNQSGLMLEEIVLAVKKVNDIIAEISAASQEQSAGIHQVNKAVSQMDEMTQQNAALVEESAAASESMRSQAQKLKEYVSFFSLGKNS